MVRWLRWHCPPDTGFEIRALAVWGRARYLSVTEAPHNTNFHTWMGKKQFCFFQTAETGNRTPDSGVKGSGANHYPRAPARVVCWTDPANSRLQGQITVAHRILSKGSCQVKKIKKSEKNSDLSDIHPPTPNPIFHFFGNIWNMKTTHFFLTWQNP